MIALAEPLVEPAHRTRGHLPDRWRGTENTVSTDRGIELASAGRTGGGPMRRSEATADHISWRVVVAGLCANLVGIGLARFAYTPLIPALVAAKWFLPAQADYLGAANLAGYLAGALLARPMAARMADAILLRAMMILAAATFFACAAPLSFLWFFVWRFAAGLAGGAIMVLAAPAALAHVPPSRRGLAGGVLFAGVGLGIAASGTLVPLLLRAGLPATW